MVRGPVGTKCCWDTRPDPLRLRAMGLKWAKNLAGELEWAGVHLQWWVRRKGKVWSLAWGLSIGKDRRGWKSLVGKTCQAPRTSGVLDNNSSCQLRANLWKRQKKGGGQEKAGLSWALKFYCLYCFVSRVQHFHRFVHKWEWIYIKQTCKCRSHQDKKTGHTPPLSCAHSKNTRTAPFQTAHCFFFRASHGGLKHKNIWMKLTCLISMFNVLCLESFPLWHVAVLIIIFVVVI